MEGSFPILIKHTWPDFRKCVAGIHALYYIQCTMFDGLRNQENNTSNSNAMQTEMVLADVSERRDQGERKK